MLGDKHAPGDNVCLETCNFLVTRLVWRLIYSWRQCVPIFLYSEANGAGKYSYVVINIGLDLFRDNMCPETKCVLSQCMPGCISRQYYVSGDYLCLGSV